MNRGQPWWDMIALLAGGSLPRPSRPAAQTQPSDKWQPEKWDPKVMSARAARLRNERLKS